MSKRRAVILAVVLEGRSQAAVARDYQVSAATVSRWVARYRAEGEAAFEPRSRRPRSSPTKTPAQVVALIVNLRRSLAAEGLDAGPVTIRWHLQAHHQLTVSVTTIRHHLLAAGLVVPNPKKKPKSSYIRFQAELPNETWQADFCHWRLLGGTDAEILSWLDDHSRYALSVTAHRTVTGDTVTTTYNHHRPHTALDRRTPAIVYGLLPKATPTHTPGPDRHRIRHDRVDKTGSVTLRHNGRLHHIGIGRAHTATPVLLIINDLDIRIVDTTTGELLRPLTLDPTRDYQPQNNKGRTR